MKFKFFQDLLETSGNDYVLFEASGLIKDGLIREWKELSTTDIQALRGYLLQYIINRPSLSSFVRFVINFSSLYFLPT